jgi:hypothetical protein
MRVSRYAAGKAKIKIKTKASPLDFASPSATASLGVTNQVVAAFRSGLTPFARDDN